MKPALIHSTLLIMAAGLLAGCTVTLAQDHGNEFQSLVQLYKALGGGWQQ